MDDQELATLLFRTQPDGRKVSRLTNGKVVLVELESLEKVGDNEWWLVRLRQKDSFAIATPVEQVSAPEPRPGLPALPPAPPAPPVEPRAIPVQQAPRRQPVAEVQGASLEPDDLLRKGDRVALFVDGAETDSAARDAGYPLDFRRARDFFVGPGRFQGGFYYALDRPEDPAQKRFLDALAYAGFVVRRKASSGSLGDDPRGRLTADVVLDMITTSDHYDVAFLFSGDGDLARCVETLRARGKRVFVVTCRNSLARDLAYAADKPVFLVEDHREVLEREARPEPAPLAGSA